MNELSDTELNCLRSVAEGYSDVISSCADNVLKRLITLQLIEQRPRIWLPLEMMRVSYHITTAGRNYLDKL